MATDDASCLVCGRPLTGRDRFERRCSLCREAEVLGQALPGVAGARDVDSRLTCPACGAARAADLASCGQCGAPLAPRAASRTRFWALVATACVLGAAWALLAWWRQEPQGPPIQELRVSPGPVAAKPGTHVSRRPAAVAGDRVSGEVADTLRLETGELLGMLTRHDYARVIDNYVQPDEEEFRRLERALDDIVTGRAAPGFAHWAARLIRTGPARTADELERAGDPHPAFTVALLSHLASEPQSSGARGNAEDRARSVVQWHLASLFERRAPAALAGTPVVQRGLGIYEIEIHLRGEREARWLRDEPDRIQWCRLPVGWVIKLRLAERVESARDVLKRSAPDASSATP